MKSIRRDLSRRLWIHVYHSKLTIRWDKNSKWHLKLNHICNYNSKKNCLAVRLPVGFPILQLLNHGAHQLGKQAFWLKKTALSGGPEGTSGRKPGGRWPRLTRRVTQLCLTRVCQSLQWDLTEFAIRQKRALWSGRAVFNPLQLRGWRLSRWWDKQTD